MNNGATPKPSITEELLNQLTKQELILVYNGQVKNKPLEMFSYYDDKYYNSRYYDDKYYNDKYYDAKYYERYSEKGSSGGSDRTYRESGTYSDSAC